MIFLLKIVSGIQSILILIYIRSCFYKKILATILKQINKATPKWKELLEIFFLSIEMKEKYLDLLESRMGMFL
ncbi:hypothetical protein LPBF_00330 [Flavobacterium crassostreae]|uniref:Uncharacterized protein n=1 Tax=Flavobacterium crassostreae TaxID=1763534 RepID=A0A1B9EA87_9FLAO|nr:hypothetical protein LPBF_00330 [Flavobacterium crassostreae]